ncbi:hypothetical protein RKD42_005095 [Streptomyces ambofaciens]
MLTPIVEQAAQLTSGREVETLFEVQANAGIPDIVLVEFDENAFRKRELDHLSFIVDLADMCVLRHLSAIDTESVTAKSLSEKLPLSAKYIGARILPRLMDYGYAQKESRGHWRAKSQYVSTAKYVGTLEAKINDWRSGYSQTLRHRASADESWLVLDSTHSSQASAHKNWFERAGIGLATLHPNAGIDSVVTPRTRENQSNFNIYRELLAERAAHLYSRGEVSGTIGLVFGADLTTTTGPDPRRSNAAARHRVRAAIHSTNV